MLMHQFLLEVGNLEYNEGALNILLYAFFSITYNLLFSLLVMNIAVVVCSMLGIAEFFENTLTIFIMLQLRAVTDVIWFVYFWFL